MPGWKKIALRTMGRSFLPGLVEASGAREIQLQLCLLRLRQFTPREGVLRADEYQLLKLGLGVVPLALRLIKIPGAVFLESGHPGPTFEH